MTEVLDMNEAAATLFPSMSEGNNPSKPVEGWPERLAKEIKENEDRAAGSYNKPTPNKPQDASKGNAPSPASLQQTKAAVESVAKEMGFDPSELPESLSRFVADNKIDPAKVKGLVEMHNQQLEATNNRLAAEWRQTSELTINSADIGMAKEVVQKYGDAEFKELVASGLGNHPALIRFLAKVGKNALAKGRY